MSSQAGTANSSASPSNKLPKKEAEIFKLVVNNYETKQYQKGLKNAEAILKKYPNHGETLAMKGLILHYMDRKVEGLACAKEGLKNDLKSHVCWHVFGLMHKSDGNYKESTKCYLQALRFDPHNLTILRDLSFIQIHMRDVAGFINSRRQILGLKPNHRVSWIGYAVGNYLGEQYSVAYDIISRYYDNVSASSAAEKGEKYDESELILFQNKCLEKQFLYREAKEHLEKNAKQIVDKISMKIKLAEYALLLSNFDDGRRQWLSLVLTQPDNYRMHAGLQCAYLQLEPSLCLESFALKRLELPSTILQLTSTQRNTLKKLYEEVLPAAEPKLKKSQTMTKIRLTFLEEDDLFILLDEHCRHMLTNSVPALYHDVCSLIRSAETLSTVAYAPASTSINIASEDSSVDLQERTEVTSPRVRMRYVTDSYEFRNHRVTVRVRALLEGYINSLKTYGTFAPPAQRDEGSDGSSEIDLEPPTALLWSLFLYCHILEKSGDIDGAYNAIEECLEHTPTALDMYLKKGKLLKKRLLFEEAATVVDFCRSIDLQDRYLNNKATKYFLRSNQVEKGMSTIALFTRHDGDPQRTLTELQCSWYELELAEAYCRLKQWGLALKKYHDVIKHYSDYVQDMFDFHNYACRKTTLRAYMETLRTQDELHGHPTFQRAATGAITVYLHFIDSPEDIDGLGHLSAKDRKKERERIKKRKLKEADAIAKAQAQALAEQQATERESGEEKDAANKAKKVIFVDEDPAGDKYLTKNFLLECEILCQLMIPRVQMLNADTLALMAEVYFRRGKYIQLLRCTVTGLTKFPLHPGLTVMLVRLVKRVRGQDSGPKPVLKEVTASVLKEGIERLMGGTADIPVFVANYIESVRALHSLPHRVAVARLTVLIAAKASAGTTARTAAADSLLDPGLWEGRGVTAQSVIAVYKYLFTELKAEPQAEQFRLICAEKFPGAKVLASSSTATGDVAAPLDATSSDAVVGAMDSVAIEG